ncbi:MAG: multidrug efflux SMR transporter [Pseudomonadota bacterium]
MMGLGAWYLLAGAIGFELIGTTLLKMSDGFEKAAIGTAAMLSYAISFGFLAPALKTIPVGVAYAIWSGIGIVAVAIIGVFLFDQRLNFLQTTFIDLILLGAIGLRLTTRG